MGNLHLELAGVEILEAEAPLGISAGGEGQELVLPRRSQEGGALQVAVEQPVTLDGDLHVPGRTAIDPPDPTGEQLARA